MTSRATRRSPRIQERRLAAIPEDEEQTVQPQQEGDDSREVEPLLILPEDEPTQAAEPSSSNNDIITRTELMTIVNDVYRTMTTIQDNQKQLQERENNLYATFTQDLRTMRLDRLGERLDTFERVESKIDRFVTRIDRLEQRLEEIDNGKPETPESRRTKEKTTINMDTLALVTPPQARGFIREQSVAITEDAVR